jgi:hypothetical protein
MAERGLVPRIQGIYRLRCKGRPALIYVGISDKLGSRLGRGTKMVPASEKEASS